MRPSPALTVAFSGLLAIMLAHESEHVVQLLQKDALGATCPNDCRGLLGFAFDIEWVHYAYNGSILLVLAAIYVGFGLYRSSWRLARPGAWTLLTAGLAIQTYHAIEHVEKLAQWFANGRNSPTPGLLGQHVSLVELHFGLNTLVFLLVAGGYFGFGLHRRLWELRTTRRIAAAAGIAVVSVAAATALWSQRPPTLRLAAGVHEGPLVVDRAQRVVGEPGAVVRGGIVVTADDVVVRDVAVLGGRYGIAIDGAKQVVLDRVTVAGAELDGINVRRGSVAIRNCRIESLQSPYAQGIDISFSFDLPPSSVQRCTVSGRQEGIVANSARVNLSKNRVTGTTMRGITVTEMSMGRVAGNSVVDTEGVGIFCSDYSHCDVEDNTIDGIRPDPTSDDRSRMGYAIQAHFHATATLRGNRMTRTPGGVAAFAGGKIKSG